MDYKSALKKNMQNLFKSDRHIDVNCPLHLHGFMEIILVLEGTLNMSVGNENYSISKGSGIFVPPFIPHSFSSPKHNVCHVLMFSEKLVPSFFDFLKHQVANTHLFKFSNECLTLLEKHLSKTSHDIDTLCVQAILAPLCLDVRNGCDFLPGESPISDNLFLEAVDYLNKNFGENISLKSVAKALGIHHVTLSKRFSEKSHISFPMYLNYIRCVNAAMLLKDSDKTIAEIAYLSGFGSIRNFNRVFSVMFDITPSQFKKSPADYMLFEQRIF